MFAVRVRCLYHDFSAPNESLENGPKLLYLVLNMISRFTLWLSRFAILAIWLVPLPPSAVAEDGSKTSDSTEKNLHEFADREAALYQFSNQSTSDWLQQYPKSLLRWSNMTRNRTFGDTYVWTEQGCARAVISIFAIKGDRNTIAAECQSLSDTPFSMRRDGQLVWTPKRSGVEFKPLTSMGTPAKTTTARASQMNRIARQFQAEFAPHTSPEEFTRLRLLSRPLFRYQSTDPNVVDGAIYGFVEATDPEMLLVIEGRVIDGVASWHYSPARSRHDQIRLYLNDTLVWDAPSLAPPWNQIRDPNRPYFNLRLEQIADPAWLKASSTN